MRYRAFQNFLMEMDIYSIFIYSIFKSYIEKQKIDLLKKQIKWLKCSRSIFTVQLGEMMRLVYSPS